jgi:hypothetical protein
LDNGEDFHIRLLAAGCWLLAAGCWLLAAGCWLLAAGCWLLAASIMFAYSGLSSLFTLFPASPPHSTAGVPVDASENGRVENMMYRLSDLSGKETGKIRATSVPAKPRTPDSRLYARIHAISLPDNTTTPPPQSDKLRVSSDKNCHITKSFLPTRLQRLASQDREKMRRFAFSTQQRLMMIPLIRLRPSHLRQTLVGNLPLRGCHPAWEGRYPFMPGCPVSDVDGSILVRPISFLSRRRQM